MRRFWFVETSTLYNSVAKVEQTVTIQQHIQQTLWTHTLGMLTVLGDTFSGSLSHWLESLAE